MFSGHSIISKQHDIPQPGSQPTYQHIKNSLISAPNIFSWIFSCVYNLESMKCDIKLKANQILNLAHKWFELICTCI